MTGEAMTLKDLQIGQSGCISKVGGNGELRQHFLDMGVIPGTVITKIKTAPMGDPVEFDVSGYELTMRLDDAAKIEVEIMDNPNPTLSARVLTDSQFYKVSIRPYGLFNHRTPQKRR